jgi:hypothetical protein
MLPKYTLISLRLYTILNTLIILNRGPAAPEATKIDMIIKNWVIKYTTGLMPSPLIPPSAPYLFIVSWSSYFILIISIEASSEARIKSPSSISGVNLF